MYFFFFKQKTAYEMRISDWSSDVCASDLVERWVQNGNDPHRHGFQSRLARRGTPHPQPALSAGKPFALGGTAMIRSIKELCHYDIAAKDGSLGAVHDLFFADSAWQVRYLVIAIGRASGRARGWKSEYLS